MAEPKDRLMQAIRAAGYTKVSDAWEANKRALDISKDLLISNTNGNRKISRKAAEKYARVFGHTPGWYLYGEQEPVLPPVPDDDEPRVFAVPLLAMVSAGLLMRDDVAEEALGSVRLSDLPPGDWIALRVQGDSMDRISPPDSIILVDRRDKRLVPNALYVIADEEGNATYKRYRPGPPPRFEPVSFNTDIEPIYPEHDPTIIGRVRKSILDM